MSAGHQLPGGARQRQRIDAVMLVEALILVGEQQLEEARIDILHRRRQPPAAFAGGIGAQQLAIAVEHHVRKFEILAERRRSERIDPNATAGKHDQRGSAGDTRQDEAPVLHLPAVISTEPVAVRPKRSGRYMSSTIACGST